MSWGKGIVIALSAFIGFIIVLVVILVSHKVDLESEDYYQQEIAYESEIESLKNSNELDFNPEISLNEHHLLVQFNADTEYSNIRVELRRPDDMKADKVYKVENTKSFTVDRSSLRKGAYAIDVYYTIMGKECLQQQTFYN